MIYRFLFLITAVSVFASPFSLRAQFVVPANPPEIKEIIPRLVLITTHDSRGGIGQGSGFVVYSQNRKSFVLTNYHVIEGAKDVNLNIQNAKGIRVNYKGKVGKTDIAGDLALVEIISSEKFKTISLATSEEFNGLAIDSALWYGGQCRAFPLPHCAYSVLVRKDIPVEVGFRKGSSVNDYRSDHYLEIKGPSIGQEIQSGHSGGPIMVVIGGRAVVIGLAESASKDSGRGFGPNIFLLRKFLGNLCSSDDQSEREKLIQAIMGLL